MKVRNRLIEGLFSSDEDEHTHAVMKKVGAYRSLSQAEDEQFRTWARNNWKPGMPVNPTWHPVVIDEIDKIKSSQKI